MDYEYLKDEIKNISKIAESVPEEFKSKCFEILLTNLISKKTLPKKDRDERNGNNGVNDGEEGESLTLNPVIRRLLKNNNIDEDMLSQVISYDGNEVKFLVDPEPTSKTQGQLEWSLLLALKNGFEKSSFETDPEDVRSICQEKDLYDKTNFASIFKTSNFSDYYSGNLRAQGSHQILNSDGRVALAKLIEKLSII